MTRRKVISLGLVAVPLQGQRRAAVTWDEEFAWRAQKFEIAWVKFLNKLAGCPDRRLIDPEKECRAAVGMFDVGAYSRARKAAAELFLFKE